MIPLANTTTAVGAYDGSLDFAGTSGVSFVGLAGSTSGTSTTTSTGAYVGNSNLNLTYTATGNSFGSGPAKATYNFDTYGAAAYQVTYNYTVNTVPEPSSFVGLGLLGIGAFSTINRKKKAQ